MSKPLMLLSLPNSGSTWFGDLIRRTTYWNRYFMEFFNPIRNPAHYERLQRHFGCELLSCYRNIVSKGDVESIHDDIRATWLTESYNFTKEVFSPLKLPVFVEHFQCVVLVRSAADSFPPRRARIWSFYEHAWHALAETRLEMSAKHFEARAIEAHRILREGMLADAERLKVPVIHYRELFNDFMLEQKLQSAFGLDDAQLVQMVSEVQMTRALQSRD